MSLREQRFVIELVTGASAEQLFTLLADAPGWPAWFRQARRVRWSSEQPGGGPGAVRLVTIGPLTVRERILTEEPCVHHAYSIETVFPVRDHRGEVWFTPGQAGTLVRWNSSFTPKFPGTGVLLRIGLRFGVRRLAAALVAAAEALPGTS
ncbi:MAG: SRPBCC family protein [Mycobacterium sp.]